MDADAPSPARSPTTFVERRGPEGRAALAALARRVRAAGARGRLLRSVDEPELHLLVVDGAPPLADAELQDARVWRFEAAEDAP